MSCKRQTISENNHSQFRSVCNDKIYHAWRRPATNTAAELWVGMPESSSIMHGDTANSKGRLQVHVLLTSVKRYCTPDSQLESMHLHVIVFLLVVHFRNLFLTVGKLDTVIGTCSRNNGRSKY